MTMPPQFDHDPWGQGLPARRPLPIADTDDVVPIGAQPGSDDAGGTVPDPDEPTEMWFSSVEEFVNDYLARILCRRLGQGTAMWCPDWWLHPEAVVRLVAMWRAFEHLTRDDPDTGMSTWWLHHADPHLRVLTDPDYGPFAVCDPVEGHSSHPLDPLPVNPAPPGIWDDVVFAPGAGETDTESEEGSSDTVR